MPVTPEQAIDTARTQSENGTRFDIGLCLQRVRLCYGIDARDHDAATAWAHAEHRHATNDPADIPRGVPVFWTGGSRGHGHIAISTGDGYCWSTDIRRPGHWDRVPIAEIGQRWGLTLVGWTEDVNGVRVWTEPTPPPRPRKQPTRYVTANLAWQLGGDAALLRDLAKRADVLALVECRTRDNQPLDVAAVLGPGWQVQQDLGSAARAGTVTAVRDGIKVYRSRLALLSLAGLNVQARYRRRTVIEDGGRCEVLVGHNPLPPTGRMSQAVASTLDVLRRVRRRRKTHPLRRWIWLGDANTDPADWAHTLHAPHYVGVKPMVICWSNGWLNVATSKRRIKGSDHYVLTLKEQP